MNYQELYSTKKKSAAEAVREIRDGQLVFSDITVSQPRELYRALGEYVKETGFRNIVEQNVLDVYPMPCYLPETREMIKGVSWFMGGGAKKNIAQGYGDIVPAYYRDFAPLMTENYPIDVFMAAVSPMDKHGYFTLGTVGSVSTELIEKASCILLEVNPNIPRAVNGALVHISQVTALCEAEYELPVLPPSRTDPVSQKIGELIAEEIPDGATLQLGIGAIPDAVGSCLKEKHHLGLHTEMLTDSMIGLLECGAADNSRKPLNRGFTVAAFAFGSKRIYDYIDDNPSVRMFPVNYVNDPAVIAQHPGFVSVNAAVEVDFFGQVCAESIGRTPISGTGGQADYVRGAVMSKGGKSFIAFPSTANHGKASRIVSALSTGAQVTTSKNDVDSIVTEYGIARLRGQSLSKRTRELIRIAHPDFRDKLLFEAKQALILV